MSADSISPEDAARLLRLLMQQAEQARSEEPADDSPQLVTLDQAAALVGRSKRTLEHYRRHPRHPLPEPTIEGGGGRPHEWDWAVMRPWLLRVFGAQRRLPERLPRHFRRS